MPTGQPKISCVAECRMEPARYLCTPTIALVTRRPARRRKTSNFSKAAKIVNFTYMKHHTYTKSGVSASTGVPVCDTWHRRQARHRKGQMPHRGNSCYDAISVPCDDELVHDAMCHKRVHRRRADAVLSVHVLLHIRKLHELGSFEEFDFHEHSKFESSGVFRLQPGLLVTNAVVGVHTYLVSSILH